MEAELIGSEIKMNCIGCGNYRYGTCPKSCLDVMEALFVAEALADEQRVKGMAN